MLLKVEGLCKAYRGRDGGGFSLRDVGFTLLRGEVKASWGENGSGKSTLVKCLVGLVEPDEMQLHYALGTTELRRRMSALIEGKDSLVPRLSAVENARYLGTIRAGRVDEQYLMELVRKLGLEGHLNEQVRQLSTGNKRKAALLCALCTRLELVFLDEPTLGLDAVAAESVLRVVRDLASTEGVAFAITSHNIDFIENIASTLLVLADGEVVYDGTFDAYAALDQEIRIVVDFPSGVELPSELGYRAHGQLRWTPSFRPWPGASKVEPATIVSAGRYHYAAFEARPS